MNLLRLSGIGMALYPVVAHLGIWLDQAQVAVFYLLVLLLSLLLYPPPRYKQPKNLLVAAAVIAAVLVFSLLGKVQWLVYLPPVIIPAIFLVVFGQSLGKGSVPLITQFATKLEGELSAAKQVYTRRVTQLWAGVFAFMVIEAVILAVFASTQTWSWVTHIGNYLLLVIVMVLEFTFRRLSFRQDTPDLKTFVMALSRYKWK